MSPFLFLLPGCRSEKTTSPISDVSFYVSYSNWRDEKESLKRVSPGVSRTLPIRSGDTNTGKVTPSKIMAMECELGLNAHLHEFFLLEELKRDSEVHRILEKSEKLCIKYDIKSVADMTVDSQGVYTHQRMHPVGVHAPER